MGYSFKVCTNIEDIKTDWYRINEENSEKDIFQLYEYNYYWCKSHPNAEQSIHICLENNNAVGIIPLIKSDPPAPIKAGTVFTNIGLDCIDYANIIATNEHRDKIIPAWLIHLESTQNDWDAICFRGVKSNWDLNNIEVSDGKIIEIYKTYDENFIIYLDNDFDIYINGLSKRIKTNYLKFMDMMQNGEIEIYEDKSCEAIDLFKKIHTERWNKVGYPGMFNDERYDFFNKITQTEYFHMMFLKCKEEIFAAICYFDFSGCRYYYQSAVRIDKKITSSISTGQMLILSIIRDAYQVGLNKFDFMNGKEAYKYIYATNTHEVNSINIVNKNIDYPKILSNRKRMDLKLRLLEFQKEWSTVNISDPVEYKAPTDKPILIIAPHFDDEILGCGGLICYCNKNGCVCDVLFMTNGDAGSPVNQPQYLTDIRKKESRNAKKMIGYHNEYYLDIKDGFLSDNTKTRRQIEKLLDLNNYAQIFVTPIYDTHNDHRESYKIIESVLKNQKYSEITIYTYESTTVLRNPNVYVDIKDIYGVKTEALKCFKSQLEMLDYLSILHSKTVHYNYREYYEKVELN